MLNGCQTSPSEQTDVIVAYFDACELCSRVSEEGSPGSNRHGEHLKLRNISLYKNNIEKQKCHLVISESETKEHVKN